MNVWTLTHCELTGQLALVIPDIQRYVLFRPQDQQAVLGEALIGKAACREGRKREEKKRQDVFIRKPSVEENLRSVSSRCFFLMMPLYLMSLHLISLFWFLPLPSLSQHLFLLRKPHSFNQTLRKTHSNTTWQTRKDDGN